MVKKLYERPLIQRHVVGQPPKTGMAATLKVVRDIDGIKVPEIIERHGSPVFVLSESSLRNAYSRLFKAMGFYFPKVILAWSYKTNWLRSVCSVFHQEGAWAEVVSEFEYRKARSLKIPGRKIVFNGPFKPREALAQAFQDDALVNLDSLDEIFLAEQTAREMDLRPRVGIRVNLVAGAYPIWSRFGFNYESGEAAEAAQMIKKRGVLDLVGLHCHLGTFVLDPYCYTESARKLADLALWLERKLSVKLDYLNLGGGFASKNTLLHQYLPGETVSPPFEEYAAAIAEGFKHAGWTEAETPAIVLETGRALVDEAGYLLTTVGAVKRLPNGVRALTVDAGVNLLYTAFWYRHELLPTKESEGDLENTVVYGPLCMNIDVVRESVYLPTIRPGDVLAVWPVGAYNMTQWLQFIRLRPRVVMVTPAGEMEVIRQEDHLDEVLAKEPLSDRLILQEEA